MKKKDIATPSHRNLLKNSCAAVLLAAVGLVSQTAYAEVDGWRPKHTVIVVLENKSFSQLIGSKNDAGELRMPYLNDLAANSALLTRSYAAPTPYNIVPEGGAPQAVDPSHLSTTTWTMGLPFVHPLPARGSQTNYFYQFAGHNQGFLPDWFAQPGSGRMISSFPGALMDQYGNILVGPDGNPKPESSVEVGLSNELVTSFPNVNLPFTTPNLGAAVISKGFTFATFSESLPYPSFNGKTAPSVANAAADGYARRHNPAINWINFPEYGKTLSKKAQRFTLPVGANLAMINTIDPDGTRYPGFGVDKNGVSVSFDQLPTVSIVVPDNQDNIHTGTRETADVWLESNIKAYADWAAQNDSLLVVTTDEDGFSDSTNGASNVGTDALIKQIFGGTGSYMFGRDNIMTLFYGPTNRVKKGEIDTPVDHLNVLATVLDMYGALDKFRDDFEKTWSAKTHPINPLWVGGEDPVRQEELKAQLHSLKPIKGIVAKSKD